MSKYYILIIEEKIRTFSVFGYGEDCNVVLSTKGEPNYFQNLEDGDKVIGFIAGSMNTFSYLFNCNNINDDERGGFLVKEYETAYGVGLQELGNEIESIIKTQEKTDSLVQIDRGIYNRIVKAMMNAAQAYFESDDLEESTDIIIDEKSRINKGTNILLYGVPGSGKSWTIEHEYCSEDSIVDRLVFHPDYTNADFVGQILPVVDEEKQVTYEFTPGPFTTIIYNAYRNPMQKYILIIEEINRGNAPAIFGEIFQLLDRKIEMQDGDDGFQVGTSEYGITHKYMAEFIYGNPTDKVRIPSNLSIIGTMNTSDQNVFTLDTAFQRRWQMRLIENNFDNVRPSLADAEILDTEVTWKRFCETVNTIIVGNKAKMASAEDKRLGVYFVHENDLTFDQRALPSEGHATLLVEYNSLLGSERLGTITSEQKSRLKEIREAVMHNRLFPEKVIKYLWDDAFKFNPEALFDTDGMDNLEKVIRTFIYSTGHDRFKIFRQTVRDTLYTAQQ